MRLVYGALAFVLKCCIFFDAYEQLIIEYFWAELFISELRSL